VPDAFRPCFESPVGLTSPELRLLLISYHFPPAQTAGALRWEKFSQYAAERGWAIDVVALHPSGLPKPDTSRLATLPAGIRVYGIPDPMLWVERVEQSVWRGYRRLRQVTEAASINGSQATAGAAVFVGARPASRCFSLGRAEIQWALKDLPSGMRRGYYAWRDYTRQSRWAQAAATVCLGVSGPQTHAAVISCGPPHMAHEAGRRVAVARGLPLVMDLRDPWSLVQRLPEAVASPIGLALADRYERRTMARAALVVANTEPLRLGLQAKYPEARSRIITVMNGYDQDPVPRSRHGRRFTIAYAGTIYLDRDPRILFRAAARVVHELALGPADFRIELMGDVESFEGVPTQVIAREEGLDGFVETRPSGPRREATEFLSGASMLLCLPQDSDMSIPSKMFEYMQYDAWVLALAERQSATERLLRGSDADVVAPRDVERLAAVLRKRYLQYSRGGRPTRLATDPQYSRREQARQLFDAIEGCVRQGSASRQRGSSAVRLSSEMTR
jgi:glycosyltransferase involved in cell wall biosynthesis